MSNKGADQTVSTRRLICTFLFAYGISRFCHGVALSHYDKESHSHYDKESHSHYDKESHSHYDKESQ